MHIKYFIHTIHIDDKYSFDNQINHNIQKDFKILYINEIIVIFANE